MDANLFSLSRNFNRETKFEQRLDEIQEAGENLVKLKAFVRGEWVSTTRYESLALTVRRAFEWCSKNDEREAVIVLRGVDFELLKFAREGRRLEITAGNEEILEDIFEMMNEKDRKAGLAESYIGRNHATAIYAMRKLARLTLEGFGSYSLMCGR
jgi:hypothetical protein